MRLHTLLTAALSVGICAAAQTPDKIYIQGNGCDINGQRISYNYSSEFDVTDGEIDLRISHFEYDSWNNLYITTVEGNDDYNIAPACMSSQSENQLCYGVPTEVVQGKGVVTAVPDFQTQQDTWVIKFTDNLTKAIVYPVLDGLYVLGSSANSVNGRTLDWNTPTYVDAAGGYITLDVDWKDGELGIVPTVKNSIYGLPYTNFTISPADFITQVIGQNGDGTDILRRYMPTSEFYKELPAMKGQGYYLYPAYVGQFRVRIKDDLSSIEYSIREPREIEIQVAPGYYDEPKTYAMTTTDGITYTYEFESAEAIEAGSVVSIVNKQPERTTNWRANGDIVFGQEMGWYTMGGETPSSMTAKFKGTVTAVIPDAHLLSFVQDGTSYTNVNNYWSETPNAKVTFTPNTATGIEDISSDDNSPAEYFNLQGVRVAAPENGIYIERRGSTVRKVVINR